MGDLPIVVVPDDSCSRYAYDHNLAERAPMVQELWLLNGLHLTLQGEQTAVDYDPPE